MILPWRPADPPNLPHARRCLIFAWIGQTFDACDECGRPLEEHLYHPPYGGERPILYVKQYVPWRDGWYWMPVGSLVKPRRRARRSA